MVVGMITWLTPANHLHTMQSSEGKSSQNEKRLIFQRRNSEKYLMRFVNGVLIFSVVFIVLIQVCLNVM